ncbi:hypothetical protein ACWJJH_08645 [Endozoicomonadaceae bacterium StTr2]
MNRLLVLCLWLFSTVIYATQQASFTLYNTETGQSEQYQGTYEIGLNEEVILTGVRKIGVGLQFTPGLASEIQQYYVSLSTGEEQSLCSTGESVKDISAIILEFSGSGGDLNSVSLNIGKMSTLRVSVFLPQPIQVSSTSVALDGFLHVNGAVNQPSLGAVCLKYFKKPDFSEMFILEDAAGKKVAQCELSASTSPRRATGAVKSMSPSRTNSTTVSDADTTQERKRKVTPAYMGTVTSSQKEQSSTLKEIMEEETDPT